MLHENLSRRTVTRRSSNRSFGLVFAGALAVLGLVPWLRGGEPRLWALALAAAFLAAAGLRPALLAPLNRLWFRFGELLARFTNPVIMGVLFLLVVTPVAFVLRARGKDLLRLGFDREARSYWIERVPPGPPPESLRHQF